MIEIPKVLKQRGKCLPALVIAALAAVASPSSASAESFGVKFLGNTTADIVTNVAGVVPISGWNNISNQNGVFTSGTIRSSDGAVSATLALSGSGAVNGWHSSATADGGDGSLMRGYADINNNSPMTATVSGLTGSSYTVYIYALGDAPRPGNGGDLLPNYAINGTVICTATLGGAFSGFVQGGISLVNTNAYPPPVTYGNYIKWDNAVPVNGVITITADADKRAWRNPINGFELVQNTVAVAPSITLQTDSSTNYAGATVQLVVIASGTPLNYQWKTAPIGSGNYVNVVDGGKISGATSSTLTISNVTTANMADYMVVITNSAGTASSVAPTTVSVITMMLNGPSPSTAVLYPGGSVQFAVKPIGTVPFSYQWRKNGTPLTDTANVSGSGTNVLTVANVSESDAGTYDVVVSNQYGSVTSSSSSLALTAAPGAGTYAQAVVAKGPVAYWRFNETSGTDAYDYVAGRNAIYGNNSSLDNTAPASPAFPGFETDNVSVGLAITVEDSAVVVPVECAPNLQTNTVTITGWIYPYTLPSNAGLVFERSAAGTAGFVIGGNGDLGYNWNDDAATWSWDSGFKVPLTEWTFVALVVSPTNATVYMYNAEGMNSAIFTHNHATGPAPQAVHIGKDPFGGRVFDGSIDEVALFNRALSNAEITQLYTIAAGTLVAPAIAAQPVDQAIVAGTNVQFAVSATGSEPLTYQWKFNGASLANTGTTTGANTATLNLANLTTANNGGYSVVVANQAGSVTSTVATLTVLIATNYDKGLLALNPLGYWRLNETTGATAVDSSSHGLNGTYGGAVTLGGAGVPNSAFYGLELNNYAAAFNGSDTSWVSLAGLNLNSDTATFTAWIKPATLSTTPDAGLIFCRDGVGTTSGFGLNPGGELGYTWNDDSGTYGWHTGLVAPINQWSFVALVVTSTNATIYLYNANGQFVATHAHNHLVSAFSGETRIGSDALTTDWAFKGAIDEAAVFSNALTFVQINGLYVNATRGATGAPAPHDLSLSIAKLGAGAQLQWTGMLLEATSVTGPWTTNSTAVSPMTINPSESQKFYRVK